MPQLFTKSADTILRASIVLLVLMVCALAGALSMIARSPYMTGQYVTTAQQIPFSHQHHVADLGIDCRYCHQSVEFASRAGVPATQLCMNCHRILFNESDMLAPVLASWREERPLQWNRVYDLPDYVYFNHSIHVHKGIACYECHGRVDRMPLMTQVAPLTMQWCLDCHRNPQTHIRPRTLVFEPRPLEELVPDVESLQQRLADEYDLKVRTDCYTCHR